MSEIESETMREVTVSLGDGHYTILETIREGRLYLAEKAGKRFVLKTAGGAKGLEMLKREYEMSIGLSHPGLAYVFTWEESSPIGPCLVQEYVDGETLTGWLKGSPGMKERRRIFGELLSAVAYLHKKGIVHNDLKPDNILVSRSGGSLKLIDLGFADSDVHMDHSLGGTLGYASPELVAGKQVDARSDIYSLGRLLQDVFPGRYRSVVRRCLRPDPGRRFPSVEALSRTLAGRRMALWIALGIFAGSLVVWSLLRKPDVVQVPVAVEVESDSLRSVVDSLQGVIDAFKKEQAENEAALEAAKAKVEASYRRNIPVFRKALREARTRKEAAAAWMGFVENQKEVNFDIPAATPEAVLPALRDYVLQRNSEIQTQLSAELTARMQELE